MGIVIRSKNCSIDLQSGGFINLRTKIAELTNPEIHKHYEHLMDYLAYPIDERKEFFDMYNKQIEELDKKYDGKYSDILDFLYESDSSGNIPYETCISLWEVIKDYDDDIIYGYISRPNCGRFRDFKKVVKDCIDTKTNLIWY